MAGWCGKRDHWLVNLGQCQLLCALMLGSPCQHMCTGHKLDCTIIPILPYWGWSSIHKGFIYTHCKSIPIMDWPRKPYTMLIDGNCRVFCRSSLVFFPHEQGNRQSVPGAPLLGTVLASGARFPGSCHTLFDGGTSFGKRHHCPIHQCCQGRCKSRVLFNSLVNHDFQWELSIHSLYRSLVGRVQIPVIGYITLVNNIIL